MENLTNKDWVYACYSVNFPNINVYDIACNDPKQVSTIINVDGIEKGTSFSLKPIEISEKILYNLLSI